MLGVDVSAPVSAATFACLSQQHNITFAIARAYRSVGSPDAAAPETLRAARAAGITALGAYHFPAMHVDPTQQVRDSVAALRSAGAPPLDMYWLDIEAYAWPANVTANLDFIVALKNAAEGLGLRVGMYSGHHSWPSITGDSHALSALPLWYAHYERPANPSFSDYGTAHYSGSPYGGWTHPHMKQFDGDAKLCGADVDVNWLP